MAIPNAIKIEGTTATPNIDLHLAKRWAKSKWHKMKIYSELSQKKSNIHKKVMGGEIVCQNYTPDASIEVNVEVQVMWI